MFDHRWVTDVALAVLIAFPAVLPSSPTPRSAQSALTPEPDRQSQQFERIALAQTPRAERNS